MRSPGLCRVHWLVGQAPSVRHRCERRALASLRAMAVPVRGAFGDGRRLATTIAFGMAVGERRPFGLAIAEAVEAVRFLAKWHDLATTIAPGIARGMRRRFELATAEEVETVRFLAKWHDLATTSAPGMARWVRRRSRLATVEELEAVRSSRSGTTSRPRSPPAWPSARVDASSSRHLRERRLRESRAAFCRIRGPAYRARLRSVQLSLERAAPNLLGQPIPNTNRPRPRNPPSTPPPKPQTPGPPLSLPHSPRTASAAPLLRRPGPSARQTGPPAIEPAPSPSPRSGPNSLLSLAPARTPRRPFAPA